MRIHWFSPLAPAHTAIADYTGRLVEALAARADLTLWTDQPRWHSRLPLQAEVRRFDPHRMPWKDLHEGVAFYNIGNDSRFHQAIGEVSRECPGFSILHDVLLHDSVAHGYRVRDDRAGYLDAMQSIYGPRGRRDAELHWSGALSLHQMGRIYSCAPFLLNRGLGAIVHSRAAERALAKEVDVPVIRLPLPFPARSPAPRRPADPGGPPWNLVVFGFLGANRCLDQTLAALALLDDPRFHLHIYGDVLERPALDAAIERLRVGDRVTVHGFVSEVELDKALAAAHLALNLRYPTKGEASYSQLRIWSQALPSLVTRVGWYAELPAGTVSFVRPEFLAQDLCAHLRAYAAAPADCQASGLRGYEYFVEHHSPRGYAAQIAALAAEAPAYRHRWNAVRMSERAAEGLRGWCPSGALEQCAARASEALSQL